MSENTAPENEIVEAEVVSGEEECISRVLPMVMKKGGEHVVIGEAIITIHADRAEITGVFNKDDTGLLAVEFLSSPMVGGVSIGGFVDRGAINSSFSNLS
jgi:hypothetical protein